MNELHMNKKKTITVNKRVLILKIVLKPVYGQIILINVFLNIYLIVSKYMLRIKVSTNINYNCKLINTCLLFVKKSKNELLIILQIYLYHLTF